MKAATVSVKKPLLQLQPQYSARNEWLQLALSRKLSYELLELSSPPALNESRRFQVYKDWYRESGLVTSIHGMFIDVDPASSDMAFQKLSRDRCRESCSLAAELGARNVVLHSSCLPFVRGGYLDHWAGLCAEFYEELAQTYHLNIYIENSQDVDPGPVRELMNRITDPRVGVCLDLGHANYSRCPVEKWLEDLGDRIGYLHLSDNNGQYDDHLPLGTGTVDWEEVDAFWKDRGGQMPATLEVGGLEGVRVSLQYIKDHGFFGSGNVEG